MADLSKIISENVATALERAKKKAIEQGQKHGWSELARRMSRRMPPPKDESENRDPDSIERQVRSYRSGQAEWRADYIEAAAEALGTHPERLCADNYDGKKVPEATVARFLTNALGRRLEPKQAREVVANLERELEIPGMFELVSSIARALVAAKGSTDAIGAVIQILTAATVWEEAEHNQDLPDPARIRKNSPK